MFINKIAIINFFIVSLIAIGPFQNLAYAMRDVFENGKSIRYYYRDEVEKSEPYISLYPSYFAEIRAKLLSQGRAIAYYTYHNVDEYRIEPRPAPVAPARPLGPSAADIARENERRSREEEARRKAEFEAQKKAAIEQALAEGAKRIEAEDKAARQAREDYFEKMREEELEKVKKESEDGIQALKAAADHFCFPAETPITVPIFNDNNQLIGIGSTQISSIHLGDPVFSCNMSTLTCEISHVTQLFQNHANRLIELSIEGRTIQATPNHPFYVVGRKDWVKAQDLQVGDQLIDTEGNEHPIRAVKAINGEFKVYNFEVEGHHTYYASGILVHNCNLLKNLDLGAVSTAGCVVTGAACAAGVASTAATGVAVPVTGGASLAELPTVVGATTQACTAAFTTCGIAGTTAFANQAFSSAQGGEGETEASEAEASTSREARKKVMQKEGIPTSQQPISQSRNESGRQYQYEVPKEGGGTKIKSVQQQTKDRSHPGENHWEAGDVKTHKVTGEIKYNKYGAPKLSSSKSKVNYDN